MTNVFFFTDIHGHYQLFSAIIKWCKEQDNQCKIIYGGDAADRGEYGYQIIKELLADTNVIYIYGNHEELFLQAADSIVGTYANNDETYNLLTSCDEKQALSILNQMIGNEQVQLHIHNGGKSTLKSWLLDGANLNLLDQLRFLPRVYSYNNLDFCHAGSVYSIFQEGFKKPIPKYAEELLIWDRSAIQFGWEKDRICIFGHIPTIYLPAKIYGRNTSLDNIHPCMWGELLKSGKHVRPGYKIDMDTCTHASNKAFVLNCNTFQVNCFTYNEQNNIVTITEYELQRP